jgi:hypothetical protein
MKKIGIMQPYFFPYFGYYSLLKKTDIFILLDAVQFIRHGWIERNRILKPIDGWQYISVPLEKFNLGTKIQDIKIRENEDWQGKILRQLEHYKKRSPFYNDTIDVIRDSFETKPASITELNKNILEKTCQYIGFSPDIKIYSEMNLEVAEVTHPGEWALNISKSMGATEYINPTGGVEIFKRKQFEDAEIILSFMGNNLPPYPQRRPVFENGLSIIDAMMFNSSKDISQMLEDVYFINELSGEKND